MTNRLTIDAYIHTVDRIPSARLRDGTRVFAGLAGDHMIENADGRVLVGASTGNHVILEGRCRVKPGYYFGRLATREEARRHVAHEFRAYLGATALELEEMINAI